MSSLPLVSVVIPAFNAQATLHACLSSVQGLTYPRERTEVLLVDNGSTDRTRAIAESFGVNVISESKRGRAAAHNRGIAEAHGQVIAFTDADCIVDHGWLAELVRPLNDETIGVVGGEIRAARPCNAIQLFGEYVHNQEKAICFYCPPYVATANWASPRNLLEDLGEFDETLIRGMDVDMAWRILQHGHRLVYQPDAVVMHQNEKTLQGLFCLGLQHGYYSVPVNRKHARFLEQFGYRRVNSAGCMRLLASLRKYVLTHSLEALCEFTLEGGVILGKLTASARYRYLAL